MVYGYGVQIYWFIVVNPMANQVRVIRKEQRNTLQREREKETD